MVALQQVWLALAFGEGGASYPLVFAWLCALQLGVFLAALGWLGAGVAERVWAVRVSEGATLFLGVLGIGGLLAVGLGAGSLWGLYGQLGRAAAVLALVASLLLLPFFVVLPWIQRRSLRDVACRAPVSRHDAVAPSQQRGPVSRPMVLGLVLAAGSLVLLVVLIGNLVGLYGGEGGLALRVSLGVSLIAFPYLYALAFIFKALSQGGFLARARGALNSVKRCGRGGLRSRLSKRVALRPDEPGDADAGMRRADWLAPVTFFVALPFMGVAGWATGRIQAAAPCSLMPSSTAMFAYLRREVTGLGPLRCDRSTMAFVSLWRGGSLQARLGGGPGDVTTQLAVLRDKLSALDDVSEAVVTRPVRDPMRLALHFVRPRFPVQPPSMLAGFAFWLDPLREGLIAVSGSGYALAPPEELVAVSAYDHGWDIDVPDVRIGLGLRQASAHLRAQLAPAPLKAWGRARFTSIYEHPAGRAAPDRGVPAPHSRVAKSVAVTDPSWQETCAASVRSALQHAVKMAGPSGLFEIQRHPLKEPRTAPAAQTPSAPSQGVGSWARQAGVTWFVLHAGRSLADAASLRAGARALEALLESRQPCGAVRCLRDAEATYFDLGAQAILLLAIVEFERAQALSLGSRHNPGHHTALAAEVAAARAELSTWLVQAATPLARRPFIHRWRVPEPQRLSKMPRAPGAEASQRRDAYSRNARKETAARQQAGAVSEQVSSDGYRRKQTMRASVLTATPMQDHLLYADGQAIMALASLGRGAVRDPFVSVAARAIDQVAALWDWPGELLHFGELHWECLGVAQLDADAPPAGRSLCAAWLRQQLRWQLTDASPGRAGQPRAEMPHWLAHAPFAAHLDGLLGYARFAPPILAMSSTRGEALGAWLFECGTCSDTATRKAWQPQLMRLLQGLVRFQLPGPYADVTARPAGTAGAFPRATASLLSRNDMTQHAGHALLRGCGLALP